MYNFVYVFLLPVTRWERNESTLPAPSTTDWLRISTSQIGKDLENTLYQQARSSEEFVDTDTLELRLFHLIGKRLRRYCGRVNLSSRTRLTFV